MIYIINVQGNQILQEEEMQFQGSTVSEYNERTHYAPGCNP
jgi:hypothetical protein